MNSRHPVQPSDVCAIIPALNEEDRVADAVRSVVAAGAGEVLVVDGGSSDETLQAARKAGARTLTAPTGRAAQQNAGAGASQGDWLWFVHADCVPHPNSLAALCDSINRSSNAVEVWGFRQQIDAPGLKWRIAERGNAFRTQTLKLLYGDQGIALSRELFLTVGGFPEEPFLEDLLLSRTLSRHGARFTILPCPMRIPVRHWARRGLIRQTARNWMITALALTGVRPERIQQWLSRPGNP